MFAAVATNLKTILQLPVPVIIQIGQHHMRLDDVLALGPGAIVELDRPAEHELELLANNKPIGRGVAVKVGENFGIRITTIGSPQQCIEALASE